jgi:hypothetical protein
MFELKLPYPASVNHYWRRVGARTLISRGGSGIPGDRVLDPRGRRGAAA